MVSTGVNCVFVLETTVNALCGGGFLAVMSSRLYACSEQLVSTHMHVIYGDHKNRTLCYIFTIYLLQVEGLIRLMEGDHVGPFNLGNPGEFTMLELAEVYILFINAFMDHRLPTTHD